MLQCTDLVRLLLKAAKIDNACFWCKLGRCGQKAHHIHCSAARTACQEQWSWLASFDELFQPIRAQRCPDEFVECYALNHNCPLRSLYFIYISEHTTCL